MCAATERRRRGCEDSMCCTGWIPRSCIWVETGGTHSSSAMPGAFVCETALGSEMPPIWHGCAITRRLRFWAISQCRTGAGRITTISIAWHPTSRRHPRILPDLVTLFFSRALMVCLGAHAFLVSQSSGLKECWTPIRTEMWMCHAFGMS